MKLLMLSADFLPNVGGITTHIVQLSRALVQRGHEVTIVKPNQEAEEQYQHAYGFSVIHLAKQPLELANTLYIRSFLRSLIKREGFHLVHWHQLAGYETKKIDVPGIFTNHTSMYLEEYESWWGKRGLKRLLNHASAVIAPSQELRDKSEILNPPAGIHYIANGVDEQMFSPGRLPNDDFFELYPEVLTARAQGRPMVLCPRRLEPKCGVAYLIQAIPDLYAKFPDICVVIAGRGGFFEEERRLKQWLTERSLEHTTLFLGDVKNEMMPYLYNLASVVVFPSLMEATSIACLEAMACAKPIVSTNVGGLSQLLQHGHNGLLVEPRDAAALARETSTLLNNPQLAERLGAQARKTVEEQFTWKIIAQQTEQIYQQAQKVL